MKEDWLPPLSRLYLPKLNSAPATILDHLIAKFPQIPPEAWRDRVARGVVTISDGTTVQAESPYRHGVTVLYRKEVASEPITPEDEVIIYCDDDILVADKPHGMPVTPAGEYLDRCLLVRLQKNTGLATLAPMHRLDRETAGVVLFSINPATRGRYHQLFPERTIEREYLAVSHVVDIPTQREWRVENRMEAGEPWYRRRIVEGPVNAITRIELLEVRDGAGLFRLKPDTGKKHQLRIHMASIGFPIVGDPLYPEIRKDRVGNPPLQLLANRLEFTDPISRIPRVFASTRSLTATRAWDISS